MLIELDKIHKHYGPVRANNGISLTVEPGLIHGILGENGAGKSTLMKILSGYTEKTSGKILVDGSEVQFEDPNHASRLGIGMLYQDPLDFPQLSVLENFILGQKGGIVDRKGYFRHIFEELAGDIDFSLQPDTLVKNLTIGERQQLEILRLLALGVKVLILDEPTTGISSMQKEGLFHALKELASAGKSILLVSHKLEDIDAMCHTVTVLRQGVVTGEASEPFDAEVLLKMMFGNPPVFLSRPGITPGKSVFVMDKVYASGGRSGLKNCCVEIRQREVIGLAGLEGSGQGVFLRTAAGLKPMNSGSIYVLNKKMNKKNHHVFKRAGVSFLPASRLEEGLIPGLNLSEHYVLQQNNKDFFLRRTKADESAKKIINNFHIKGAPKLQVEYLSGGNQQRLLLSFLPIEPTILLLENPTRGLDVESVQWTWQYLHSYCERNASIVFSSSEIDEILMFSDRVLVFFDGHIVKDVRTVETDINELGRAIAGKA
ncbi:MAG: ATP-binding cassette domain-containing protein [Thermodesulfobacteriota bacterium]|nr:ATP-binding cassette domain-containing protein [Thermodesulfobacteriota bacterium]